MDCDDVRDRLPWLLAGSLEAAEAAAIEAHLAGCAACREEVERTRLAARLFATHPTAGDLVAHAFGDAGGGPRAAVEAHLASCEECRRELALVAASRDAMHGGAGGASLAPRPGSSRAAALAAAAAIAALLASGGWLVTWQRWRAADAAAGVRQAALERRIERLEAGASRDAAPPGDVTSAPDRIDRVAALEREVAGLRRPSAGLAVLELVPDEMVVRGGPSAVPAIPGDEPATLLLLAEAIEAGGDYRLRVEAASWEGAARAVRAGELALHLPTGTLPPGSHRLEVLAAGGEPIASYRIAVR